MAPQSMDQEGQVHRLQRRIPRNRRAYAGPARLSVLLEHVCGVCARGGAQPCSECMLLALAKSRAHHSHACVPPNARPHPRHTILPKSWACECAKLTRALNGRAGGRRAPARRPRGSQQHQLHGGGVVGVHGGAGGRGGEDGVEQRGACVRVKRAAQPAAASGAGAA
eukprot:508366-Rhodomonas_salina.1